MEAIIIQLVPISDLFSVQGSRSIIAKYFRETELWPCFGDSV